MKRNATSLASLVGGALLLGSTFFGTGARAQTHLQPEQTSSGTSITRVDSVDHDDLAPQATALPESEADDALTTSTTYNTQAFTSTTNTGDTRLTPFRTSLEQRIKGIGDSDLDASLTVTGDQNAIIGGHIKPSITSVSTTVSKDRDDAPHDGVNSGGINIFQFGQPTSPDISYVEGFTTAGFGEQDGRLGRNAATAIVGATPQLADDGAPREQYAFILGDSDHEVNDTDVELGATLGVFGTNLADDPQTYGNLEASIGDNYIGVFNKHKTTGGAVSTQLDHENAGKLSVSSFYQEGPGSHWGKTKVVLGDEADGPYGSKASLVSSLLTLPSIHRPFLPSTIRNGETTFAYETKQTSPGNATIDAILGREEEWRGFEAALGLGYSHVTNDNRSDGFVNAAAALTYNAADDYTVAVEATNTADGRGDTLFGNGITGHIEFEATLD